MRQLYDKWTMGVCRRGCLLTRIVPAHLLLELVNDIGQEQAKV